MAVTARIINLDQLFTTTPHTPIILNDYDISTDMHKEEINQILLSRFGSDFLELEPSCDGGHLRGGYLEGQICPECQTPVVAMTERPLETAVWLGLPKGVKAFIHPKIYAILNNALTLSKFSILEHLVNPSMHAVDTRNPQVKKYLRLIDDGKLQRGINHFVDHFDEILRVLADENILQKDIRDKQGALGRVNTLLMFLAEYRDNIFCQYLPMPTKLLMITEKTLTTTFASKNMFLALNAARTISSTASNQDHLSLKTLQSRAMKANALMAEYSEACFKDFYDSKDGWFRQHVFGTRSHFTFRAVINSLSEPHRYDELHIPWSLGVMVFRTHLIAKLLKKGWSIREAQTHLDEHTLRYSRTLDRLFQELIGEAPGQRIGVLFNRNPSLLRGSMQLLYITKVKTDIAVRSISLSVLVLRNFNADFDGDRCMSPVGGNVRVKNLSNCWELHETPCHSVTRKSERDGFKKRAACVFETGECLTT